MKDDARQAVLKVPRRRVNLTDAVADDAVRIMVEVRAGRGDAVDQAALQQWDEAGLVEAGRRHRTAEGEKDRAILLDASTHQVVGGPLLAANVGGEGMGEDLVCRLVATDGAGTDVACLFESSA